MAGNHTTAIEMVEVEISGHLKSNNGGGELNAWQRHGSSFDSSEKFNG